MTQALLRQAIEAIRRGDKAAGQRLLAQVLRADPRSETAWLWMSQIVESDAQRLDCLRRILAINPSNAAARRGVELLEARMRGEAQDAGRPLSEQPPAPSSLFSKLPTGQETPIGDAGSTDAKAPALQAAPIDTPAVEASPAERKRKKEAPSPRPEPRTARRSLAPILLALVLVVGGIGVVYAIISSRPVEPVTAPVASTGLLAISLETDGGVEIALIRSDGTKLTGLLDGQGIHTDPAWSPDGARIAFTSRLDAVSTIAVVDANGGGFMPITRGDARSVDPAWSPDGTRIAFAADPSGDFDIYVLPATQAGMVGSDALDLTRFEGDDRAPSWTPDSASIVFQSDREGQPEIYSMEADGSNPTQLTRDPADDTDPSVSPDGTLVAFVSTRGGDADIFVMRLDGSGPRPVTDNPVEDRSPSWTPDGSILFTSVFTGGATLYAVRPDGSDLRPVAGGISRTNSAAWQPLDVDPATLAARAAPTPTVAAPPFDLPERALMFASNRDGPFDFFRMRADGTDLGFQGVAREDERHPAASPDGSQLAFDLVVSDTRRIFIVDAAGQQLDMITLTQESVSAHTPAWSPDGAQIAYEIVAEGGSDIVVSQPDGSGAARLISRPGYDGCLSWRLDGKQIAFTSDRDGGLDIYLMTESGSAVERLTRHPAADRCPAWSPDGARIAFLSNRNGEGVYLMNADGSNARLLVAVHHASQPVWSSDGQFLLVASDQDGDSDIYLISVDHAAIWNLTPDSAADEVDPAWLP
jgi:Tol biopolymer transport system component